ncbi:MAG: hypothetical protein Ta2A_06170 [Treponemataceae bacterium]|nr:MAG: hypothetical protein Ta2A_06170 [Treponemataceae bacterium]
MKKLMLCVVVLLGLGTGVYSASSGWYNGRHYSCTYLDNMSSEKFEWIMQGMESKELTRVAKVPNSVLEVVSHALSDYRLDVGDVFVVSVVSTYTLTTTVLSLRITGGKQYTYYAFQEK